MATVTETPTQVNKVFYAHLDSIKPALLSGQPDHLLCR